MKHIFCVHSPITYLVSLLVIEQLGLNKEQVMLLTKKINLLDDRVKSFPDFETRKRTLLNKLMHLNEPKVYDNYISSLVGSESFIAYVPLMDVYHRLLVTHINCVGFNFIEEGMKSYYIATKLNHLNRNYKFSLRNSITKDFIEFKRSITYILRGWTLRILEMPFTYEAYTTLEKVNFYCIAPEAFPLADDSKKVVLSIDSKMGIASLAKGLILPSQSIIWLEDSYARNNKIPLIVYERAIEHGIIDLKKIYPNQKIYLKLRPGETINNSVVAQTFRRKGIAFSELDINIILETLMATNKNLIFVGNVSSALFYAAKMGHESWSIYDLFDEHSNRTFNNFPVFWNYVNKFQANN